MKEAELEIVRLTEANLLGALLIDAGYGNTLEVIKPLVNTEDFLPNYRDQLHRRIFKAMLDTGGHTDQITVANKMKDAGTLRVGDVAYMLTLIANFVDPLDCEHYAKLVANNAQLWRGGGQAKPRFTGVV